MEAMEKLRDDFDGDVPKTVEELTGTCLCYCACRQL